MGIFDSLASLGSGSGGGGRRRRSVSRRHTRSGKNGTTARRHDKIIDYLLSSMWFRPALWMIACSALGIGLVVLDTSLELDGLPKLLRSDPDDARAMLGAIAGAMLTVVSLAFSVVMLAVVQMAQNYSPQLLRQYIADTRNQHVLGILLGTFLYSLLVLRSIRLNGFAPTLATNMGVILAVVATIALVAFLHHVPQSMKVSSIIGMILEDCEEELEREFPSGIGASCEEVPNEDELSGEPIELRARSSGYIELFDIGPLVERQHSSKVVIQMHWRMGDFVLEGSPLASIWGEFDERDCEGLHRACVFGRERTMRQDPRFGLAQLTDVALRALSPGINDPSTACDVTNALAVLFAKLLAREPTSAWRCDASGLLRIEFKLASFVELIEASYLRILDYGGRDQQVVRRLIAVCEQLAAVADTPAQHEALWSLLQAVHTTAGEKISIDGHRRTLDDDFERVRRVLKRVPLANLRNERVLIRES